MKIDELVVELGLDSTKFTDQQREAVDRFRKTSDELDKRIKGTEELSKKTGAAFGDMTHAAEGLFTAIAGAGMAAFARQTMDAAASTGRMAVNVGVTTRELSAFGRMIERNGGSADAASASLKGYADQMQRLREGAPSADFLMGLAQVGATEGDSPIQVFKKLARFAESHSAQAVNVAGQRLGFSQDVINVALKGSARALEEYKRAFDGAVSSDQAEKLTTMQESWSKLGQAVKTVGTDMTSNAAPAFSSIADKISGWLERNRQLASSLGAILSALVALTALKPAAWLMRLLGLGGLATAAGASAGVAANAIKGGGVMGLGLGVLGMMKYDDAHGNVIRSGLRDMFGIEDPEGDAARAKAAAGLNQPANMRDARGHLTPEGWAFIRRVAIAKKIDPDTAAAVARAEGGSSFISSIPGEKSYGAFQLNVTPGGRKGHLGDLFQKKTGLDPSDPNNEAATVDFALDWVARSGRGWRDFHGAKNTGIGQFQGIGSGDVTIGQIVLPNVTDAQGFARDLPGAIKSGGKGARDVANNANTGLRQ